MLINFRFYQLKEQSERFYELVGKNHENCEFIIVGEAEEDGVEYFKVLRLFDDGETELDFNNAPLLIKKGDLEYDADEDDYFITEEYEVPENKFTSDELSNIQRLNLTWQTNSSKGIDLYNADPNCIHEIEPVVDGGCKCNKCGGWYCL